MLVNTSTIAVTGLENKVAKISGDAVGLALNAHVVSAARMQATM